MAVVVIISIWQLSKISIKYPFICFPSLNKVALRLKLLVYLTKSGIYCIIRSIQITSTTSNGSLHSNLWIK